MASASRGLGAYPLCRWCNGVRVPPLLPVGLKIHRDLFWPRARPRPPENVIAAASSSSSPSPAASSSSSSSPSPAASSPCVESTRALVGQAVHLARGIRSKLSSSQQAHAIQRSKSDKSSRVEARSIDLQIAPNGDCRYDAGAAYAYATCTGSTVTVVHVYVHVHMYLVQVHYYMYM